MKTKLTVFTSIALVIALLFLWYALTKTAEHPIINASQLTRSSGSSPHNFDELDDLPEMDDPRPHNPVPVTWFRANGKHGLYDQHGNVLLEPTYDCVLTFF